MVLILLLSTANAAPPLSGAIFTTDYLGQIVNGNTKYLSKCGVTGVWLDGGPGPNAPITAAGLPDGDYYFQVTDPSGKKLLSTDPVEDRCVTVSGGIIVDNSCSVNPHVTNPSADAGGGIVVELCPYIDTPNHGGVYKAWVTPVGDGTVAGGGFVGDTMLVDNPCGNGCFHGFIPARSKTDNYKTEDVALFCIAVHKDIVRKGANEPGVGWKISITDGLNATNQYFTDADGNMEVCGLVDGFYTVEEELQAGYTVIATSVDGTPVAPSTSVQIQLKNGQVRKDDTATVVFQNEQCGSSCPK